MKLSVTINYQFGKLSSSYDKKKFLELYEYLATTFPNHQFSFTSDRGGSLVIYIFGNGSDDEVIRPLLSGNLKTPIRAITPSVNAMQLSREDLKEFYDPCQLLCEAIIAELASDPRIHLKKQHLDLLLNALKEKTEYLQKLYQCLGPKNQARGVVDPVPGFVINSGVETQKV